MEEIVLVSDNLASPGNRALQQALAGLGTLLLTGEENLDHVLDQGAFKLLILDAAVLNRRPEELIHAVKSRYPELQVVLLTASPHWKIAKAVILAGAEYIEKNQDPEVLAARFAPVFEALANTRPSGVEG